MKKILILLIFISFFLYSCKKAEVKKEEKIIQKSEKIDLNKKSNSKVKTKTNTKIIKSQVFFGVNTGFCAKTSYSQWLRLRKKRIFTK